LPDLVDYFLGALGLPLAVYFRNKAVGLGIILQLVGQDIENSFNLHGEGRDSIKSTSK
jgi:hypothetical protein